MVSEIHTQPIPEERRRIISASEYTAMLPSDHIDELTGLPNRKALYSALEAGFEGDDQISVVIIDLDHFKAVNDEHGHKEGDDYLKNVGSIIYDSIREDQDMPAALPSHLSGDEFAVVFTGVREKEDLDTIVQRLHTTLDEVGVPNSIGGAMRNEDDDASSLLSRADSAMNEHKQTQQQASLNTYTDALDPLLENMEPHQAESMRNLIMSEHGEGKSIRTIESMIGKAVIASMRSADKDAKS